MRNLKKMPEQIAHQALHVLQLEQAVANLKEAIAAEEAEIDRAIAFSESYKNDAQRKAARSELLEGDAELAQLRHQLKEAVAGAAEAEIELTLLRNTFAIAKLEARERIARTEALVA